MDRERFEKIKEFVLEKGYADRVGFAVWNEKNINDLSMFSTDLEKNLPIFNAGNIIVGLNASGDPDKKDREAFGAFHCSHRGGRDRWLLEVTKGTLFEGAYMTDIFKTTETDSGKLLKDLNANPSDRQSQIDAFIEELEFVRTGAEDLNIIALGKDAYTFLPEKYKNYAQKVVHFAYPTKKEKFFEEFHKAIAAFEK